MSRMFAGNEYSDSVNRLTGGGPGLSVANAAHEFPALWQGGLSTRLPRDTQDEREDSLFQELIVSGKSRPRNPWSAAGALAFQVLALAALIIVPLYFTDPLPKKALVTDLYLPQPPAAAAAAASNRITAPTMSSEKVITPNPGAISAPRTHETPPVTASTVGGVTGGVPGGVVGGVVGGVPGGALGAVLASTTSAPVLAKGVPAAPRRVASRIAEGNLIHDVAPEYPPEAGRARLEGSVVLLAVIGKDGSVQDVQVKSGLPVLAQAAIDAVKQWRYKPYLLNGEPVEVATQITINFTMAGG